MTSIRRIPEDHPKAKNDDKVFPMNGPSVEDALDEMDDVGIDGFDDEDDEVELSPPAPAPRAVAVPVPVPVMEPQKRSPRKPPPRQARPLPPGPNARTLEQAAKAQLELDEFLAGLSFGEDQHRIIVSRLEPTHNPRTGEICTGILKTYYTPITGEDIQKAFGGGLYEIRVMGPDALSGRKNVLRKRDTLRIAGKARLEEDEPVMQEERRSDDGKQDLFLRALESKEREVERLAREAREAQKLLLESALKPKENDTVLTTVISLIKEQQNKTDNSITSLMQAMREERLLEEERRREERRAEEERRREERRIEEDRRREERELELERRREEARRHEKEMEILRQNAQRDAVAANSSTEVLLKFMEQSRKEEQERMRAEKARQDELAKMQFEVMQQGNKQAVEMVMESSKFQMGMLQSALQEAKSTKRGGISEMAQELLAFKAMQRELSGEADEEPESTVDKIFNRVEALAPSLAGVASSFMTSRAAQSVQAPQVAPPPQRLALVDQGPVGEPTVFQNPTPPRNALVEMPEKPLSAQQQPQENEVPAPDANDFTSFNFPKKGADVTEVVTTLVKNLDFAIASGKSAEDIADEVLPYYVENFGMVAFMIKKASADDLVAFIEERVPATWAIATPAGEKVLRELHEIANED
jgi:hypothetical protein